MPNGYAVTPAIIPGNVTIQGNLTINGDELKLGTTAPFGRIVRTAGGNVAITKNLLKDLTTQEVGGIGSASHGLIGSAAPIPSYNLLDNAGNPLTTKPSALVMLQGGVVTNTGNTTENVLASANLQANQLGSLGALRGIWELNGNVQGGVATTFRIKLGATVLHSWTKVATAEMLAMHWLQNMNAQNVQRSVVMIIIAGAIFTVGSLAAAVDTSVQQAYQLTIQGGANTDSWDSRFAEGWCNL